MNITAAVPTSAAAMPHPIATVNAEIDSVSFTMGASWIYNKLRKPVSVILFTACADHTKLQHHGNAGDNKLWHSMKCIINTN